MYDGEDLEVEVDLPVFTDESPTTDDVLQRVFTAWEDIPSAIDAFDGFSDLFNRLIGTILL